MRIIPLSEGAFTVDATKKFIPFNKDVDDLQQRTKGSLLVEIQPFAVVTSNDVIVIDSGLGFTNDDGVMQIHRNLLNNGIDPYDVSKVLMSHLHKDHSGGISKEIGSDKMLSFPNATYYVNKQELHEALHKGSASYITEDINILESSDKVQLLEGNGVIDDYIRYELTGAHSPFHQVFWIIEGGEKVFFGGDVAPQLQQLRSKFVAKYDYDGKKSMQLRQEWWSRGEQEKWSFLFYHDIKQPVYKFA